MSTVGIGRTRLEGQTRECGSASERQLCHLSLELWKSTYTRGMTRQRGCGTGWGMAEVNTSMRGEWTSESGKCSASCRNADAEVCEDGVAEGSRHRGNVSSRMLSSVVAWIFTRRGGGRREGVVPELPFLDPVGIPLFSCRTYLCPFRVCVSRYASLLSYQNTVTTWRGPNLSSRGLVRRWVSGT